MHRLYLFTLEIVPLEVGATYNELPSHLTLMSRFTSSLTPEEIDTQVRPLFAEVRLVSLTFGATIELGPKKVTVHMIDSPAELALHEELEVLLAKLGVVFQYPQFIGNNHRPHVTKRKDIYFAPESQCYSSAAYLIEVIGVNRVVRSKFVLSTI